MGLWGEVKTFFYAFWTSKGSVKSKTRIERLAGNCLESLFSEIFEFKSLYKNIWFNCNQLTKAKIDNLFIFDAKICFDKDLVLMMRMVSQLQIIFHLKVFQYTLYQYFIAVLYPVSRFLYIKASREKVWKLIGYKKHLQSLDYLSYF